MIKFLAVLITLTGFSTAFSLDQTTIDSLEQQGMQVIMGELTGAGSKATLHNLTGFILHDGILLKENCARIVIKDSKSQNVSNIVRVVFENQNIEAQEFEGIIIRK